MTGDLPAPDDPSGGRPPTGAGGFPELVLGDDPLCPRCRRADLVTHPVSLVLGCPSCGLRVGLPIGLGA